MSVTPEVYVDQRRDEVLVRFDFCGPVHSLTREGVSVIPSRPLFEDELVWTPELTIDTEDAVEKARDEAHSEQLDAVEEAQAEGERQGREAAEESAREKVLEAVEAVLDLGEVRALLNPALAHARDTLRDELVDRFGEALS